MRPAGTVFDCMVFVQAIASRGSAYRCLQLCLDSPEPLLVSAATLQELGAVLMRPELRRKLPGITPERVEALMHHLAEFAHKVDPVPLIMEFPPDPKDEPYLNLAIVANARDLVTRDRAMLRLTDPSNVLSRQLTIYHPTLRILVPEALIQPPLA